MYVVQGSRPLHCTENLKSCIIWGERMYSEEVLKDKENPMDMEYKLNNLKDRISVLLSFLQVVLSQQTSTFLFHSTTQMGFFVNFWLCVVCRWAGTLLYSFPILGFGLKKQAFWKCHSHWEGTEKDRTSLLSKLCQWHPEHHFHSSSFDHGSLLDKHATSGKEKPRG